MLSTMNIYYPDSSDFSHSQFGTPSPPVDIKLKSLYDNVNKGMLCFVNYTKNFLSMSNSLFAENCRWQAEVDEKWDTLFENSEDFLAELADEALAEYLSGKTEPLDLELL